MSKLFRLDRVGVEGDERRVLGVGEVVALDPHRFGRVLRLQVGEQITLVDVAGDAWQTIAIAGEAPRVEVVGPAELPAATPRRGLEVWVPLLKGGKADDLVRALVELGATRIVPFSSRRSVVRLDEKRGLERQRRMQAIADEACQQCGRGDRPAVTAYRDGLPEEGPGVFLWEGGGRGLNEVPFEGEPLRVLTGPEGGLDAGEVDTLERAGWVAAWLGHRVLRAETACLALTVLAQARRSQL